MTKSALLNALAASAYIVILVLVIQAVAGLRGPDPDTILLPMMMLSLFVLSAATMGYLFLYQPTMLYLDGHKKHAVTLFVQTVGVFAAITALFVIAVYFVSVGQT